MPTTPIHTASRQQRLRTLIRGRALFTLGLTVVLSVLGPELFSVGSHRTLLTVAIVYLLLQLAGAIALRWELPPIPVAAVTTAGDVAAITLLAWLSGGMASPVLPLVVLALIATSLLFGRVAGFATAAITTAAFGWLVVVGPAGDADVAAGRSRVVLLVALTWLVPAVTVRLAALMEQDLRQRTEDLSVLRDLTPGLDPRQGPDAAATAFSRLLVERLGYASAAVWLPTDGHLRLAGETRTRRHPATAPAEGRLSPDDPLVAAALSSRSVVTVRRDEPRPAALTALFDPRAVLLMVPLTTDGADGLVVAVPAGRIGRPAPPRPRQTNLLRTVADQAAPLLDNARLQAELAAQALTDPLTGLGNQRYLRRRLSEELDRVARRASRGEPRVVSLALLDLDRFKRINDTYGHPTGDAVLSVAAAAIDDTLRGSDVVCRYGGEEFAVVLADSDVDSARTACQRILDALRATRFVATDGREIGTVTASVGVTTVAGEVADEAEVLARADEALYVAKRSGRDRVVHTADLSLPVS